MLLARALAWGSVVLLGAGCFRDSETPQCDEGHQGCGCTADGTCLEGLRCASDICVSDGATGSSSTVGPETDAVDTGTAGPSDSDSTGDECAPPLLLCDGSCIDPATDDHHCGQCDRMCIVSGPEGYEKGHCIDGSCEPHWVCAPPDAVDCGQVCDVDGGGADCTTCEPTGVFAVQLTDQSCDGAEFTSQHLVHGADICTSMISIPASDALFCCCTQTPT